MSGETGPWTVEYVLGDVTRQETDAIVNAANRTLGGGGGVDGAIHRAAGPELLRACLAIPQVAPGVRCPTGEARITPGFALPARFVIHTVGPVYDFDTAETCDALLADAHRSVLGLAEAHGLRSIALPAVSCGVYGFPFARAGAVVRGVLRAWTPRSLTLVRFVFPLERDRREFCRKRE